MFAPEGYTPLSSLWCMFEERYLKWCCARACEFYTAEQFSLDDHFGSPRDLCEDLFLESFSELRVTLCTSEGSVLDIDASLSGTNAKLFQKAAVMESFSIAMFEDEAGPQNEWLIRMGSPQFRQAGHTDGEVKDWITEYAALVEREADFYAVNIPFHTLPYLFERQSYVIARHFPPWSKDMWDDHYERNLPEHCRGASICLKEVLARRWQDSLSEAALRNGLRRLIHSVSLEDSSQSRRKGGRPSIAEEAARLIKLSEKELEGKTAKEKLRFLEQNHGLKIGQTTLRKACRKLHDGT